jgi:hypothetical protein
VRSEVNDHVLPGDGFANRSGIEQVDPVAPVTKILSFLNSSQGSSVRTLTLNVSRGNIA